MHCPQCGQQQVADVVRFCSRCGFPLDGVMHLLANGGALPAYQFEEGSREISPRKKGVRQGAALLLSGAVLVPLLAVLDKYTGLNLEIFAALAAVILFIGGPLRMLFAALFEEGASTRPRIAPASYVPPAMPVQRGAAARAPALPPQSVNPASGWRPRPNTAEIPQPPSVTESTTRLLDDQDERHSNK